MKKSAIILGLVGVALSSCIKHEVIPAPEKVVEFDCSFEGYIGGAFVEYTENVNNYYSTPTFTSQTQANGTTTSQYHYALTSQSDLRSVRISMGSILWSTSTGTDRPALSLFNDFFKTNDTPPYSDDALNGFMVTYTDVYGDEWKSYKDSLPQDVEFLLPSIIQESDAYGDYSKFTCMFSCPVYHVYVVPDLPLAIPPAQQTYHDSVVSFMIENAVYKGYFKR